MADPSYDNPSYNIFYTGNHSQTPSLTLTILLRSWPINSYPYATLLPSGAALVVAGETVLLTFPCWCFARLMRSVGVKDMFSFIQLRRPAPRPIHHCIHKLV